MGPVERKLSNKTSQNNALLAANTKKENNYNALKDIFEIAFMVLLCLQGKAPESEEGREDEIRDLRAIQMVKGFTETNNGYS